MSRSSSSKQWLREHFSDPFVKQAHAEGYRSRAAFKLIELQKRDNIIKAGMTVIDLGAAPGGWAQLIAQWVGEKGKTIALDILPMAPIAGVAFILGDFRETACFEQLLAAVPVQKADVIVSDMAPNTSGLPSVDQPRALYLAELSLLLAEKILKKNGGLVIKVFQGAGYDAFLKNVKALFKEIHIRKPEASRGRSRENYLVAKGFML